jgi:hypothetical protein
MKREYWKMARKANGKIRAVREIIGFVIAT